MTQDSPHPSIIIQTLSVYWGKESRGGKLAEKRARLPRTMAIPHLPMNGDDNTIIHTVDWYFWGKVPNDPKSRFQSGYVRDRWYTHGPVHVKLENNKLNVVWTGCDVGQPNRCFPDSKKNSFTLNDGQWGQIQWNGRFTNTDYGSWSYRSVTANIAFYTSHRPESGLFLKSTPTVELDQMVRLF